MGFSIYALQCSQLHVARRLSSEEDVGEAIQETILSSFKNLQSLKNPSYFRTWLCILLEFLIEWAQETGVIKKINLRTRSDNGKAIKLYQKYGFIKEGVLTRDICINGEFYDSVSMGFQID